MRDIRDLLPLLHIGSLRRKERATTRLVAACRSTGVCQHGFHRIKVAGWRDKMKIEDAVNIDDLRRLASRRLPRIAFDFIEGGVEDEHCVAANEKSFSRHRLLPRYMVDIARRDQSAALFGQSFASPFGMTPTGYSRGRRPPPIFRSSCRALPPLRSKRRPRWRPRIPGISSTRRATER